MVTIHIEGNKTIYLPNDEKITYKKQVNDLADIRANNASFTSSFKIPKTHESIEIFENLGYVGDTSTIPYSKVLATLKYNGINIITDGWLIVNDVNKDHYNVAIIDGIIDFYKEISDKKLSDLNLSELNHLKNVYNVGNSFFMNLPYCYILNHYTEPRVWQDDDGVFTNIDYLVPSAKIKYLWDKIFSTLGWTYSGSVFDSELFNNAYITYPKSNSEPLLTPIVKYTKEYLEQGGFFDVHPYFPNTQFNTQGFEYSFNSPMSVFFDSDIYISGLVTQQLVVTKLPNILFYQNGNYHLNIEFGATADYHFGIDLSIALPSVKVTAPVWFVIMKGNQQIAKIRSDQSHQFPYVASSGGDILSLKIISLNRPELLAYMDEEDIDTNLTNLVLRKLDNLDLDELEIVVSKNELVVTDFTQEFKNFSIKDFIKEISIRYGLTAIPQNDSRHISFFTLEEMLNTSSSNVINWSDKYIARTNEEYTIGSYAQKNWLRHKYTQEDVVYNDGFFHVNNQNLDIESNYFESKFFSPEEFAVEYPHYQPLSDDIDVFPTLIWSTEVKDNDGVAEVTYKSENNRYYLINTRKSPRTFRLKSVLSGQEYTLYSSVPVAQTSHFLMKNMVDQNYNQPQQVSKLFNNTRVHQIELILDLDEIQNIDFKKVYYFEQEANYYKLNNLQWKSDSSLVKGEFVRVTPQHV